MIGSLAATVPQYVLILLMCATSWWCSTQVQTKIGMQQFSFCSSSGQAEIKDVKLWFCCPALLLCWDIPFTQMVWHARIQIRPYNFFRAVKRKDCSKMWTSETGAQTKLLHLYICSVFEDIQCALDTNYIFLKTGECKLYQPLQSHQTPLSKTVI